MSIHARVTEIVNKADKEPTIINLDSNFVVSTYWWGRGKLNRNTARPCGSFYEEHLKNSNKHILGRINSIITKEKSEKGVIDEKKIIDGIFDNLKQINVSLISVVSRMTKEYINRLCDEKNIDQKASDRFRLLREKYPEFMPAIENPVKLSLQILDIINSGIEKNKQNLIDLYEIDNKFNSYKAEYVKYKSMQEQSTKNEENIKKIEELNLLLFTRSDPEETIRDSIKDIVSNIKPIRNEKINLKELANNVIIAKKTKEQLNEKITKVLKNKDPQPDGTNKSIFDLLIDLLEYKKPVLFETMIENFEKSCRENKCNYLTIEYSEFAEDGGYQLAINAKPKFIERALELCGGRSVLYIDGDETIRQYPAIFDMKNVDFMARGWWIDPRSSWKTFQEGEETILYDPYNFETSGGIMFFSSSEQANKLIKLWIQTAEKEINTGKADDRVLSLIFNTKAILTWIRIIQLPIEYLWLTLDYDERMLEFVYEYNNSKMNSTIFVDHPECLTSEDTATGAGASSDRQPKFYDFLEDLYPCVETTHEYIMFKELVTNFPNSAKQITEYMKLSNEEKEAQKIKTVNEINAIDDKINTKGITKEEETQLRIDKELLKTTREQILYLPYLFWYYHYMGGVQYINDGNPDLIDLGYVVPDDPGENAAPLNIISYKDRFGVKKHPYGEGLSVNKIVDITIDAAKELSISDLYKENSENVILTDKENYVEIEPNDINVTTKKNLIRIILRLLLDGKNVLYNPSSFEGYNSGLHDKVLTNINTLYKNSDFVFHPIHKVSVIRSNYYRPHIDMNQVILFRPDSRLIDFLSMQLSLEDLSIFINVGSYEFMSLIRIAFIFKSKPQVISEIQENQSGGRKKRLPKYDIATTTREYLDIFEAEVKPLAIKKKKNKNTRRKNKNKKSKKSLTKRKHK
tara:strand:+ start:48 stop:2798 length:2751 start_codon:yes stop_codon:yes gene_type:complete